VSSAKKFGATVLTSPTGFIKLLWAERKTGVTAKFHYHAINNKAHPRYGNHGIYSRGERTRLAILYTTKQIYRECAHAFWQTNTFVLEPDDLFLVPGLLEEGRLSTSFCRKMRHVQFDIDIMRPFSRPFVPEYVSIKKAVDILEKMADDGSAKTLSIKPIFCHQKLEDIIYTMRGSMCQYLEIMGIFNEISKYDKLANLKRTVEIEIGWEEMDVEQQHKWLQNYEALTGGLGVLRMLAGHMGGFKGEMWADGKLCFARVVWKTVPTPSP
jgi:hypothetical protein